jgi:hypothetical protein
MNISAVERWEHESFGPFGESPAWSFTRPFAFWHCKSTFDSFAMAGFQPFAESLPSWSGSRTSFSFSSSVVFLVVLFLMVALSVSWW